MKGIGVRPFKMQQGTDGVERCTMNLKWRHGAHAMRRGTLRGNGLRQ